MSSKITSSSVVYSNGTAAGDNRFASLTDQKHRDLTAASRSAPAPAARSAPAPAARPVSGPAPRAASAPAAKPPLTVGTKGWGSFGHLTPSGKSTKPGAPAPSLTKAAKNKPFKYKAGKSSGEGGDHQDVDVFIRNGALVAIAGHEGVVDPLEAQIAAACGAQKRDGESIDADQVASFSTAWGPLSVAARSRDLPPGGDLYSNGTLAACIANQAYQASATSGARGAQLSGTVALLAVGAHLAAPAANAVLAGLVAVRARLFGPRAG